MSIVALIIIALILLIMLVVHFLLAYKIKYLFKKANDLEDGVEKKVEQRKVIKVVNKKGEKKGKKKVKVMPLREQYFLKQQLLKDLGYERLKTKIIILNYCDAFMLITIHGYILFMSLVFGVVYKNLLIPMVTITIEGVYFLTKSVIRYLIVKTEQSLIVSKKLVTCSLFFICIVIVILTSTSYGMFDALVK